MPTFRQLSSTLFAPSLILILLASTAAFAVEKKTVEKNQAATPAAEKKITQKAEKKKENKADKKSASKEKAPVKKQEASPAPEEALVAPDIDETLPLPPYPAGTVKSVGKMKTYTIGEEDTLLDVARHFRLGFIEARAANPTLDPWTPLPGEVVTIPSFKLLPRTAQDGIVVNLAQMRMYYFDKSGGAPVTFPIGIGREGLQTPTGETTVTRKADGPTWFPTERMREEKPYLPLSVAPGPSNPLGTHALYLGWPTFLIHGSNKPWAIGRRVSSGCMRMYPEDIIAVFNLVPVGTKVTIVDQPILVAWIGDELYLEANPSKTQGNDLEINGEFAVKPLDEALKKTINDAAGDKADMIDWEIVKTVVEERKGYPVLIANANAPLPPQEPKETAPPEEEKYDYN